MAKEKLTSADMIARLRTKFAEPNRFVCLFQLANNTGGHCDSWIDAAVVSLWPSDGRGIDAYEIKVSRSDFTRELADPNKNQWCRDQLSSFSYVVAYDVWKEGDNLPAGAGLYVAHGDGLKQVRNPAYTQRKSYSMGLMAALTRSLVKVNSHEDNLARQAFFKADPQYLDALAWKTAAEVFVRSRGGNPYISDPTPERLAEAFAAATIDAHQRETQQRVRGRLDSFQDQMLRCFENFAEIAQVSLSETDELGKALIDVYGGSGDAVARSRHQEKRDMEQAKRRQEQRDYVKSVAEGRQARREQPIPDVDPGPITEALEALESLSSERPGRIEKSPRGEPTASPFDPWLKAAEDEELAAPVMTLPLTPEPGAGLCPKCLIPAADCSCPPV